MSSNLQECKYKKEHITQKSNNQKPRYQKWHRERKPKSKHKRNKKQHKNNDGKEQKTVLSFRIKQVETCRSADDLLV
jgi:hypothetical protein